MNQGDQERQVPLEWFEFGQKGGGIGVRVEYSGKLGEALGESCEQVGVGLHAEAHLMQGQFPNEAALEERRSEIEEAKTLFKQQTGFSWEVVEEVRNGLEDRANKQDDPVEYLKERGLIEFTREKRQGIRSVVDKRTAWGNFARELLGDEGFEELRGSESAGN
jgi:hypothetical protein